MTDMATIAVLDFGKTNLKLCVTTPDGHVVEILSTPNETRPGAPWPHHDLRGLGEWVMQSLAALAKRHPIAHLVPTGHGSGGVLVGDDPDAGGDGATLPMIDYETPMPPAVDAAYAPLAGSFHDRGSSIMMASTHAARQLLRMQMEQPAAVARARWFLNVAQYWAWWLSGVAVSEHTAMGAQSQFWNVPARRFAPIVAARNWGRLMPPFAPAWAVLGPLREGLAARFGLTRRIDIHTGGHDSSVNLYRYAAAGITDFTLVSTGTWIVALSGNAPLAALDETLGMTLNADVYGNPVGGALTMGGRAFSRIAGPGWQNLRADQATVAKLAGQGTMALPTFGENEGQFTGTANHGRIIGPAPEPHERRSLALLHAALLTTTCADCLQGGHRLILDGAFLNEPLFAPLVAALRPHLPTDMAADPAGTAAGAALLVGHMTRTKPAPLTLIAATPLRIRHLTAYAQAWHTHAQTPQRTAS